MVSLLANYLEHFTYLALLIVLVLCGLGLPLPEDVALLAGGFLAHRGLTRFPITVGVSLIGVVTGDSSLFFLGRRFGQGLLRYFGLGRPDSQRRIARLQEFMLRHGDRTVFYGRFLAGLRALIYLSAGSLGVPPSRFFFYDILGALISVPVVVSLGYFFGGNLETLVRYIGGAERAVLLAVALSAAVNATRLMIPSRRADRLPPDSSQAGSKSAPAQT